jgi:hypothetical protein
MQEVLTTQADKAGRMSGFVQRASKVSGSIFTQTLVFGSLATPQPTLEQFTQTTAALGVELAPQSLDERFSREAASCLEQVLAASVQQVLAAEPVAIPLLARFAGVYVQDSTTIVLPESLAEIWRGCGGAEAAGNAALKLQLALDLLTGHLLGPQLHDGRESDRNATLELFLPPGSVRIGDLGFFDLDAFAAMARREVYFFSRGHASTCFCDADGRWWSLLAFLQAKADQPLDVPIRLGKREQLPARLLAIPVPQQVASQRRRRLRKEARAKGETPSRLRLALAAWTVFVTNIPPELLSLEEALVLGRTRWQIELLFKLWKSHGQVDLLRDVKPWRVLCEIYAKLIGMIVQHWLLLVSCWQFPDRSLPKAAQTIRLHVLGLAKAMRCLARLVEEIGTIARCIAAGCRINRRKQHPNTFQLLLDITEGVLA